MSRVNGISIRIRRYAPAFLISETFASVPSRWAPPWLTSISPATPGITRQLSPSSLLERFR